MALNIYKIDSNKSKSIDIYIYNMMYANKYFSVDTKKRIIFEHPLKT